jgi:SAF domain-containing protein
VSKTATHDDRTLNQGSSAAAPPLVPPPKLRRRPALLAAGLVAILLGAVGGAWAWTATTNTQQVLVARHTIERGAVITADDLARVRVSADPALRPVSAGEFNRVVGQRAAVDVAEGAMLTPDSFSTAAVPSGNSSVVGVALTPAQVPALELQTGDRVRVVVTPAEGQAAPTGAPQFSEAEVAGVHRSNETGHTIVDLLVPHADAAVLAARAATGNVALVLDSRER